MATYVAIASNAREFEKVLQFAGKKSKAKIKCICQDYWPRPAENAKNMESGKERDLLSEKEIERINEKAAFFARNWYKFSPEFEQAIQFRGIQLGFVSVLPIFGIFKRIFLLLKSASNAVALENPVALVAVKGSFSAKCAKIVADNLGRKFIPLHMPPAKKVDMLGNIRLRKLLEVKEKIAKIASDALSFGGKPNAKTVFVRSNYYLGGLPAEIQKQPAMQVVSLDTLVVRKLLNPFTFAKHLKTKVEKRAFFVDLFSKFCSTALLEEKMVFEEMPFADAFIGCMPRFTERDWPEFVFLIDILLKEFEKHRPGAVVLWEDFVPFERICAVLAKRFGAKSLVVQHGLFEPVTKKGDWVGGYAPLTADRIAVWSKKAKQSLVRHQVAPHRIAVTGSPRFDAFQNREFNPGLFRKKLGIRADEKLVVLATEVVSFNETVVKEILEWFELDLDKKTKKRFVVKIRAFDNASKYRAAVGNKAMVVQNIDLYELLNASDLLISRGSTVGLEGMALGKLFISFCKFLSVTSPYKSTNAVLKAKNREQLKRAVSFALDGRNKKVLERRMKKFVYEIAFKQDGKATERIIKLIKTMIER